MSQENFTTLIKTITADIKGRNIDKELMDFLNFRYSPSRDEFRQLAQACRTGIREGWLCNRETGGIKFGRIIKPGPETLGFSVDVVEMENIAGPHHRHPNGEIDMIIPETGTAKFDGHGAGWLVYEPDSAHKPTVMDGRAIILYLLPDGAIEFTK